MPRNKIISIKPKPWKEISRETVLEKFGRGIEKVVFELPDERQEEYYIKKEHESVAVLAITKDNMVILAKQFRSGPNKVLVEMPGGGCERGESPMETMQRELLEETGYEGEMEFVTSLVDCGYSTRIKNCFVATNCKKVSEPKNDENEFIEVELKTIDEFRELLQSGQCTDIEIGYLALDYLGFLKK